MAADAPSVPTKNAKRTSDSHEFALIKELVAPLPQNAPKLPSGAPKCTKTLLYQNLRYNSKKRQAAACRFSFLYSLLTRRTGSSQAWLPE